MLTMREHGVGATIKYNGIIYLNPLQIQVSLIMRFHNITCTITGVQLVSFIYSKWLILLG